MQAALLRGRVQLPPPPPRPQVLPRPHRARARRAADAGEALVVEGVVGHGVVPDVAPDPVPAPVGEGIQLDDAAVIGVDLDLPDLAARHGLLPPEPRDPRVEALEGAAERLHLPDAAAELPVLDARVEEVDAVRTHHGLHRLGPREVDLDREAVAVTERLRERVGLGMQATGVEGKHPRPRVQLHQHVDQHDVLGAEARGEGDPRPEPLERPAEQLDGVLGLERRVAETEGVGAVTVGHGHSPVCGRRAQPSTPCGGRPGEGSRSTVATAGSPAKNDRSSSSVWRAQKRRKCSPSRRSAR